MEHPQWRPLAVVVEAEEADVGVTTTTMMTTTWEVVLEESKRWSQSWTA